MKLFSKLFNRNDSEFLEEEKATFDNFDKVYIRGADGKLVEYVAPEEEEDPECSKQ